jgi:hypothetical protein
MTGKTEKWLREFSEGKACSGQRIHPSNRAEGSVFSAGHDRLGMQFVDSTRAPVPRHSAVGGQQRPSGNREAIPSEVRFGSPTDFTFWLLLLAHYECPNGVRCTLATQVVFAVFPLTSGKPLAAGALIGF